MKTYANYAVCNYVYEALEKEKCLKNKTKKKNEQQRERAVVG